MTNSLSPTLADPTVPPVRPVSRRRARTGACVVAVVTFIVAAAGCSDDDEVGNYSATPATNAIDASLASRLSFATSIAGTYCIASRLSGDADIAALQAAGADKPLDPAVSARLARGVADCGQDLLVTSVLARIGTTGVTAAQISECRTKIAAVQSSAVGSTDPISVDVVAAHLSDPTLPWVPAEVGC